MPELWTGRLESVVFVSFINYTLSMAVCLVLLDAEIKVHSDERQSLYV